MLSLTSHFLSLSLSHSACAVAPSRSSLSFVTLSLPFFVMRLSPTLPNSSGTLDIADIYAVQYPNLPCSFSSRGGVVNLNNIFGIGNITLSTVTGTSAATFTANAVRASAFTLINNVDFQMSAPLNITGAITSIALESTSVLSIRPSINSAAITVRTGGGVVMVNGIVGVVLHRLYLQTYRGGMEISGGGVRGIGIASAGGPQFTLIGLDVPNLSPVNISGGSGVTGLSAFTLSGVSVTVKDGYSVTGVASLRLSINNPRIFMSGGGVLAVDATFLQVASTTLYVVSDGGSLSFGTIVGGGAPGALVVSAVTGVTAPVTVTTGAVSGVVGSVAAVQLGTATERGPITFTPLTPNSFGSVSLFIVSTAVTWSVAAGVSSVSAPPLVLTPQSFVLMNGGSFITNETASDGGAMTMSISAFGQCQCQTTGGSLRING